MTTAPTAPPPTVAPRHRLRPAVFVLALVPALIVLVARTLTVSFVGRPDDVPAYQLLMNFSVLARGFGMFFAVLLVWGALRSRGAPRWLLAIAILGGPVAYGVTAAVNALQFFPPGQAAYYGINPIFWAAVGAQCAVAALCEMVWRRVGSDRPPAVTWRLVATVVVGFGVTFVAVLWHGGVHTFYVYQQGYLLLFT